MSVDYYLRTWKVTKGDTHVKEGQRIKIQRNPDGGENVFEFVPEGLFGDGGWGDVDNLNYLPGSGNGLGYLVSTVRLGDNDNYIDVQGDTYDGKKHITCSIASLPAPESLPKAKRIVAKLSRILHRFEDVEGDPEVALRIARLVSKLGNIFEAAGEWEAEDDGG